MTKLSAIDLVFANAETFGWIAAQSLKIGLTFGHELMSSTVLSFKTLTHRKYGQRGLYLGLIDTHNNG